MAAVLVAVLLGAVSPAWSSTVSLVVTRAPLDIPGALSLLAGPTWGILDYVTPLTHPCDMDAQLSLAVVAVVSVLIGAAAGAAVGLVGLRRRLGDHDSALSGALSQLAVLNREQLGAQTDASRADLSAKKDAIAVSLDEVRREVRGELDRLTTMVDRLGRQSAERFGQVDQSLTEHARIASQLADATGAIRDALANPKARGQWGERMADDVLRLAGFVENVNYVRQSGIVGREDDRSGIPDYTFLLPRGQVLHMDVKFPLASYSRFLDAINDVERQAHLRDFLRDVRLRVRELSGRRYAESGSRPSVDFVVLFLPNEQLAGFIHEHDAELIDVALSQKVVLCSPLTLYAFLGVIRQAHDNFTVEQTSDQILALIGSFETQWSKFIGTLDTVKKRLDSVQREFDAALGTRRRALERPLHQLEDLRRARGIELASADGSIDGSIRESFGDGDDVALLAPADGDDLAASSV
jgi:DNA recombination protein RmuC